MYQKYRISFDVGFASARFPFPMAKSHTFLFQSVINSSPILYRAITLMPSLLASHTTSALTFLQRRPSFPAL